MATIGFEICLLASMALIIYMASKNYENINIHFWTIMILSSFAVLGYWLKSRVTTPEAAEMAFCFIYVDSTILLTVTIFSMLRSFGVEVKPWVKVLGYTISFAHLYMVWKCFGTNLYYKTLTVTETEAGSITKMTSGPLKLIHTIYLSVVFFMIVAIIIAAFLKKGTYSRRVLFTYAFIVAIALILYAVEMLVDVSFSNLPYLYVLSDIVVALDYDQLHMHDIACLISEQQKYYGNKGYVALDLRERFLSCNTKVFDFVPELRKQRVDEAIADNSVVHFAEMIEKYKNEGVTSHKFKVGEITCVCEVTEFSLRKDGRIQGYLFDFRDASEEQKVLDIMSSYNETLNAEIAEKTENIANIQKTIVIGMANIIENRDNNTGGHVKRTSDIVHILVDEMIAMGTIPVENRYAADVVRAAPMHDLGKVSIDSSILCKPARLTDDEYKIMKTHAVKSGEMVQILLNGVEEQHFVDVAYNIARYHHERWDGKGYPEGLVGSMIPLEARIMAIADVYDALVSKRCYKESMSFEAANDIMCKGMGTQFDPNLKAVFCNCRTRLENYYRDANANE